MTDDLFGIALVASPVVLIGAALLTVVVLVMRRPAARGSRFSRAQRWIAGLAVAATVIPAAGLLISGTMRTELLTEPAWISFLLVIPISVALLSALSRMATRTLYAAVGALLLAAFCLLGAMSIGPLYVPAALLLLIAGVIGLIPPRTA